MDWEIEDERLARRLYEEDCRAMEKAKAIEKRDEIMAREMMRQLQEEEVPPPPFTGKMVDTEVGSVCPPEGSKGSIGRHSHTQAAGTFVGCPHLQCRN